MPILALDNHVTEIDTDAHVDAAIVGHILVALGHAALDGNRALNRIDHATELGQEPVSRQLEDAPSVLFDLRLEQFFAVRLQPRERTRLILLHESGVPHHIGSKDGREMTLGAFLDHRMRLPLEDAVAPIVLLGGT
jgi:hypothetical protein